MRLSALAALGVVSVASVVLAEPPPKVGDAALGTRSYDEFETPEACAGCHADFSRQYEQTVMSQAFTHPWDEIEYFELALPHALKEPKVAGVKAGCNGCHAPLAFLANDIPPKRVSEKTRANESVSCDLCHSIVGFEGDTPFNFNWIVSPGRVKQGPRKAADAPVHDSRENPFLRTAEYCGTCHNEKDPWGIWVKATHLEWKEGPYGKAGIVCQDCHMPPAAGRIADMDDIPRAAGPTAGAGETRPDARQHLFHGAHDPGKLRGAVEVRIHPDAYGVKPQATVRLTAVVLNAKAGHKIPSGSAEERVLWLDVEATDPRGRTYRLPVDRKGFPGEEYTIASDQVLAYQDIGEIKGIADFRGLPRDGEVPNGDRIFRLPYLDPKGRMTIAQWNTATLGPTDYRLAPLHAVSETFTWKLPKDLPRGEIEVTARIYYSRLVSSVAEFMKVPREESLPLLVNTHTTKFVVAD